MTFISLQDWNQIFEDVAITFSENEKKLNNLDSLIGDGDHGSSVKRGFDAVQLIVSSGDITTIGELFSKIGIVMISSVGGAIGPLLGTFFTAASKPAKNLTETDLSTWAEMLSAGAEKVCSFGKASRGEKTLLDALLPANEVTKNAALLNLPLGFALRKAADAAMEGASETRNMVARFGRAKYLGERSIGFEDPGAHSISLFIDTIANSITRMEDEKIILVHEINKVLSIESEHVLVRVNPEKSILEIKSKDNSYSIKQAHPFQFLLDQNEIIHTTRFSDCQVIDNKFICRVDTDRDDIQAYLIINFPLSKSCQIELRTNLPQSTQVIYNLESSKDEQFFGGGERFSTVNQRGKVIDSWTSDRGLEQKQGHPWTYWPVPFFISNRGFGFLVHNAVKSTFDLCASDPSTIQIRTNSPNFCFEMFSGDHPIDNIDMLLERTGRPPVPPKWNNGVWVTCLGGQEVVLEKARFLREEHVPCSALWVYDAHDANGNIGWPICPMHHSGYYHNVPSMIKQLHDMGFRVQTYLFPYFYTDSKLYPYADQNGYFLKNANGSTYVMPFFRAVGRETVKVDAAIIDFTNPAAKDWWQDLIRYILVDLGYDGWMHDFGENIPEEVVAHNGLSGLELHNLYPVLYQQSAREVCEKYKPDASFYARSGFTGSQRWITASWPGDQICTWEENEGIKSVLPACLSLNLVGVFFIGPDIGGYFGRGVFQEHNCFSKELWIRWTQLGAFSSIMRDHLGDKPDGSIELWTDQETLAIFKKYAGIHMALSPYIQGCANDSIQTGSPLMRHMFLVEPENSSYWNCDDQYLFGDALLVAPILDEGQLCRTIHLPKGGWIDYWNGDYHDGGDEVTLAAPIDQIPVLVKEFSVIPTLLDFADTLLPSSEKKITPANDNLRLQIFVQGTWWEGISENCSSNRHLADGTDITLNTSNKSLSITIISLLHRKYQLEIPTMYKPDTCSVNGITLDVLEKGDVADPTCIFVRQLNKTFISCTGKNIEIELAYKI